MHISAPHPIRPNPPRLRFTGATAAIHARDLVDAAFTSDFTGFRPT
ncbi:hypothetical protein ACIQXA_01095 [Streptomyces massasporeus]